MDMKKKNNNKKQTFPLLNAKMWTQMNNQREIPKQEAVIQLKQSVEKQRRIEKTSGILP